MGGAMNSWIEIEIIDIVMKNSVPIVFHMCLLINFTTIVLLRPTSEILQNVTAPSGWPGHNRSAGQRTRRRFPVSTEM